ncbi:hypothetical protein Kfla_2510 [Kribbella flavida DSM 17836]|uniref:Uncharacterized protein n=1 Tax=Kribbella flavida (strain DSM 17836 / JCM 10339 / NBRC 14399) TaxID=479435 RepID=D2PWD2_KRIFD|nr:hypothetical protein Kfla_2510 [Kribbella flavida DSM 17836]
MLPNDDTDPHVPAGTLDVSPTARSGPLVRAH